MAAERVGSSATTDPEAWSRSGTGEGPARCFLKKHLGHSRGKLTVTDTHVTVEHPMGNSVWRKVEKIKGDWLLEKVS